MSSSHTDLDEPKVLPVTILTGFLGVGKTTFLNHLIEAHPEKRFAIVENEFGEQSVDSELIITPDDSIVQLNNGCLCCTLNDNLYDILNELHDRRDEIDEVIIEATGVADPTGLAQPFIAHPLIKKHFPLTAIVCLVDAALVDQHIEQTEEAKKQIAYSDLILINKTDLVDAHRLEELNNRMQLLNPLSTVKMGCKEGYPALDYRRHNQSLDEVLMKESMGHVTDVAFPVAQPHHHHHHDHTEAMNSHTFVFDRPFDLLILNLQLSVFFSLQADNVYRMKGVIWLKGYDHRYVLQSVGKRFDLSELPASSRQKDDGKSVIIVIGKQIQREGISRMLKQCLAKNML